MLFQCKATESDRGKSAPISLCMSRIKITLELSDMSLKTQSNSTDTSSFAVLYSRDTSGYWILAKTGVKPKV